MEEKLMMAKFARRARRRKNPPPPDALAALTADYETAPITSRVSRIADGVLLSFSSETQFLLMTPRGARQIAEQLIAAASEADPPPRAV
jgi:hypothetical protein